MDGKKTFKGEDIVLEFERIFEVGGLSWGNLVN